MPPMSNFYARICVKATPSSNKCASLCAKFRFTARELRLPSEVKPRSAVSGAAFAPKYKNPDGPETWSGRGGRKPVWFTEALARGIPEEAMRIKPGTVE